MTTTKCNGGRRAVTGIKRFLTDICSCDMDNKALFKPATVNKLLQLAFQDQQKTKVNNDALKLMSEMMRTFVAEAAARSGQQAQAEAASTVQTEHLEKILPQLLLDF